VAKEIGINGPVNDVKSETRNHEVVEVFPDECSIELFVFHGLNPVKCGLAAACRGITHARRRNARSGLRLRGAFFQSFVNERMGAAVKSCDGFQGWNPARNVSRNGRPTRKAFGENALAK